MDSVGAMTSYGEWLMVIISWSFLTRGSFVRKCYCWLMTIYPVDTRAVNVHWRE